MGGSRTTASSTTRSWATRCGGEALFRSATSQTCCSKRRRDQHPIKWRGVRVAIHAATHSRLNFREHAGMAPPRQTLVGREVHDPKREGERESRTCPLTHEKRRVGSRTPYRPARAHAIFSQGSRTHHLYRTNSHRSMFVSLFAKPPHRYVAEDVQLQERLQEAQGPYLREKSTFSMADVTRARLSLKPRKTCRMDLAFPDMIQATGEADWHRSAAPARRI